MTVAQQRGFPGSAADACDIGAFEVQLSERRGHLGPDVSAAAAEPSCGTSYSLVDQMLTTRSEIA
jgi:hypothetical protein